MKLLHCWVSAILMLTACQTTRVNHDKGITRPTYCYPVDRC